jgi:hypothetical protein
LLAINLEEAVGVAVIDVLGVKGESDLVVRVVKDGVEMSQEGVTEEVHVHAGNRGWDSLDGNGASSLTEEFLKVSIRSHGDLLVGVDDNVKVLEVWGSSLATTFHHEETLCSLIGASGGFGSRLEIRLQ